MSLVSVPPGPAARKPQAHLPLRLPLTDRAARPAPQLMSQLVFYGQYHSHPLNQLIHFIFVPVLMWTVLVWAAGLPALGALLGCAHAAACRCRCSRCTRCRCSLPLLLLRAPGLHPVPCPALRAPTPRSVQLTAPLLLVLAYALFYTALEPVAGLSWALAMGAPLCYSSALFAAAVRARPHTLLHLHASFLLHAALRTCVLQARASLCERSGSGACA